MIAEPMGARILVRPDAAPDVVRGIARPDNMDVRPESGVIIAIGPDAPRDGFVTEGDHIAFPLYSGYRIKIDGEEVVVLTPDEIMFRVRPEDLA